MGKDKITVMLEIPEQESREVNSQNLEDILTFSITRHEGKEDRIFGEIVNFFKEGRGEKTRVNRTLQTFKEGQRSGCSVTEFHQGRDHVGF